MPRCLIFELCHAAQGGEPRQLGEYRAGDILEFRIHSIESPFGDMQLSNDVLPTGGDRFEDMWEEMEEMKAQRKQARPSLVMRVQKGRSDSCQLLRCRPCQRTPALP